MRACIVCDAPATHRVGFGNLNLVCERCADIMIACEHNEGTVLQRYDEDGVGYRIWVCDACGFREFDQ
jgi:hypothetical protein